MPITNQVYQINGQPVTQAQWDAYQKQQADQAAAQQKFQTDWAKQASTTASDVNSAYWKYVYGQTSLDDLMKATVGSENAALSFWGRPPLSPQDIANQRSSFSTINPLSTPQKTAYNPGFGFGNAGPSSRSVAPAIPNYTAPSPSPTQSPTPYPFRGDLGFGPPAGNTSPVSTVPSPVNPSPSPSPSPTATNQSQNQSDPFTSWMGQQGLFPYNMGGGWNPATGYNPASTGYNPAAMPNYSMDPYP